MKILCVSDHVDPLVYTCSIKTRFKDIDLVLSAGDLPMEYNSFIVSVLNKPLLFIFGNHNLNEYFHYRMGPEQMNLYSKEQVERATGLYASSGTIHAGGRIVKAKGLLIAGLGGSMNYNNGINQYTEFGMMMRIIGLIPRLLWNRLVKGRYLDILLTHAPPRGIHDQEDLCHTGFKVFLWFMRRFKPKYLVHGHIHLYNLNEVRKTLYHKTMVVNAYDHCVIDFEE